MLQHNAHFGDEDMINRLYTLGRLVEKRQKGSELTKADLEKAAAAKM